MVLTETQTRALDYLEDDETEELLFGGAAGGGKSTIVAYFGAKMCVKYPGSRGMFGRAILKTLNETTVKTFWEVVEMQGIPRMFKPFGRNMIKCANGSEILLKDLYAYPSDPEFDELGSLELTWAGIDECNQITVKAKNIVKSRIRFKLKQFNLKPKLVMSCNPAKNWTRSDFYYPYIKGTLPKKRKFIQSLLSDNPHIYEGYRSALEDLDEASRERLLYANWDYVSDISSLISADAINNLFNNSFVKGSGIKYITADIARMGTDKTVIRVWDGWRVVYRMAYGKTKVNETAEVIKKLAIKYSIPMSRVICDEDGVGGGVVDILGCKGFVANASPFNTAKQNPNTGNTQAVGTNYANLKAQCAWHLASILNSNKAYEKLDGHEREMLEEELEQIKQKNLGADGKRQLLSKEQVKLVIGRSPDDSDTYIMRAWFDVAKVGGIVII